MTTWTTNQTPGRAQIEAPDAGSGLQHAIPLKLESFIGGRGTFTLGHENRRADVFVIDADGNIEPVPRVSCKLLEIAIYAVKFSSNFVSKRNFSDRLLLVGSGFDPLNCG